MVKRTDDKIITNIFEREYFLKCSFSLHLNSNSMNGKKEREVKETPSRVRLDMTTVRLKIVFKEISCLRTGGTVRTTECGH